MKHRNKLSPTIASTYHVNTPKVCLQLKDLFQCFLCLNLKRNFCLIQKKLMKLYRERPVLTSQVDGIKQQKQLRSEIEIHLDQSANFGPFP